jgi:hypothetical protein
LVVCGKPGAPAAAAVVLDVLVLHACCPDMSCPRSARPGLLLLLLFGLAAGVYDVEHWVLL